MSEFKNFLSQVTQFLDVSAPLGHPTTMKSSAEVPADQPTTLVFSGADYEDTIYVTDTANPAFAAVLIRITIPTVKGLWLAAPAMPPSSELCKSFFKFTSNWEATTLTDLKKKVIAAHGLLKPQIAIPQSSKA